MPSGKTLADSYDGKYIIDLLNNVYSTSTNRPIGKTLSFGQTGSRFYRTPLFFNDDKTVYFGGDAVDFENNTIIINNSVFGIVNFDTDIAAVGYLIHLDSFDEYNIIHIIDPITLDPEKEIPYHRTNLWGFGGIGASKDGVLALIGSYQDGTSALDIVNLETGEQITKGIFSDYIGDIVPLLDDTKFLIGSYGNSLFGGGGVYVFDRGKDKVRYYYEQFGASRLTLSSRYVFTTSAYVDHYGDGTLTQGSIYHRGVEVLHLNAKSELEFRRSYFLCFPHDYSMRVRLLYAEEK